jgi:hypothetical protein
MALHGGGAERAALAELRRAERLFGAKPSGAQVTALIRTMRARAPDSLRTVFTADSLTYEGPREVAADSATTTAPGPQEGHHRP